MRTLPRRVFLQDSAALAASMATLSGLAGADAPREDKADNKPVGPNDTLRVAVCGVHGRGMDHVAGWSKLNDVRITTICDVDLSATVRARKAIAARYGAVPPVVQDIRRVRRPRLVVKAGRVYDPVALMTSVEGKIGPSSSADSAAWAPQGKSGR